MEETIIYKATKLDRCHHCQQDREFYLLDGTSEYRGVEVPYQLEYDPVCREVQGLRLGQIELPIALTGDLDVSQMRLIINNNIRNAVRGQAISHTPLTSSAT